MYGVHSYNPAHLGGNLTNVGLMPIQRNPNEYEGAQIRASQEQQLRPFEPSSASPAATTQPFNGPNLRVEAPTEVQQTVLQPRALAESLRRQVRREYSRWEQEGLPNPTANERDMSAINRVIRNVENTYSPWIDRLVKNSTNFADFFIIASQTIRDIRNNNELHSSNQERNS